MEQLLPIQKLETLSIDTAKKQFLINGKEFGKGCLRISIECVSPEWRVEIAIAGQPYEFFFDLKGAPITK